MGAALRPPECRFLSAGARAESAPWEEGSARALQREYRPPFRQMMESANRALMEILTEDRRVRYDSIDAAAESRRERRRSEGRR